MPTKESVEKRKKSLKKVYVHRREVQEEQRQMKREAANAEKEGAYIAASKASGGYLTQRQVDELAEAKRAHGGRLPKEEAEKIAKHHTLGERFDLRGRFEARRNPTSPTEAAHRTAGTARVQRIHEKGRAQQEESYAEKEEREILAEYRMKGRSAAKRDVRAEQRTKVQRLRSTGKQARGTFMTLGENFLTNEGLYVPEGTRPVKGGGGQQQAPAPNPFGPGGPYDLAWGVGLSDGKGGGLDITSFGPPSKGRHPLDFTSLGPLPASGKKKKGHPLDFDLPAGW